MTKEDFQHPAYLAGKEAANKSALENHARLNDYANPYYCWTREFELWNLGWNHKMMQHE